MAYIATTFQYYDRSSLHYPRHDAPLRRAWDWDSMAQLRSFGDITVPTQRAETGGARVQRRHLVRECRAHVEYVRITLSRREA
jgi:hypothetical protein